MHSNLALRLCSAILFAPLILVGIWYNKSLYEMYGVPVYTMLLAALGVGLSWEWCMMFYKKLKPSVMINALCATIVAFVAPENPWFCVWLVVFCTLVVFLKSKSSLLYSLGTAYICVPLIALSYIYYVHESISRELILWLLAIVWATDIGGYMVGCTLKGPKIAPKISAGKTWSGLCGAVVFAMLTAYVFALYLKAHNLFIPGLDLSFEQVQLVMVLSAGGLALISQAGDFFESFIKRRLKIKDSSNLIPGHGGLFDRFDGLLFASTSLAFILFCLH